MHPRANAEASMQDDIERLREELAALRAEVAALRVELAELRTYIGEVPAMECGITSYEEWRKERG
jgi:prefoldin subunit 5